VLIRVTFIRIVRGCTEVLNRRSKWKRTVIDRDEAEQNLQYEIARSRESDAGFSLHLQVRLWLAIAEPCYQDPQALTYPSIPSPVRLRPLDRRELLRCSRGQIPVE